MCAGWYGVRKRSIGPSAIWTPKHTQPINQVLTEFNALIDTFTNVKSGEKNASKTNDWIEGHATPTRLLLQLQQNTFIDSRYNMQSSYIHFTLIHFYRFVSHLLFGSIWRCVLVFTIHSKFFDGRVLQDVFFSLSSADVRFEPNAINYVVAAAAFWSKRSPNSRNS